MSRGRILVLFLVFFLVAVLVASIAAVISLVNEGGGLEERSVLVIDIAGSLPEQPQPEAPLPGLGTQVISMMELDSALRKAAVDDRIERLLLRPGPLMVGYGKVQELRAIIERFSIDSGKPTTCWMESTGNKEYYLATACDEIFMAPEGFFMVNGLHMGVTFYKGLLDKVGVEAEFARAGKYKSAIEPMTSQEMSPSFRDMLSALADSLFDDMVEAIASARGLTQAEVRALIDDPPLTAASALELQLIDGLLYEDQLFDHLSGRSIHPTPSPAEMVWRDGGSLPQQDAEPAVAAATDDDDSGVASPVEQTDDEPARLERVSFSQYAEVKPSSLGLGKGPRIAVLYCEGTITSGESQRGGGLSSQSMGSDTIADAIRSIRKDDSIRALVLRVDSPGGSGVASDLIWRELERTRELKPVVVSMSDYAASGGYYISAPADAIVAQPGTLTGSIGVFAGKYNLGGLYEKAGLVTESIKRGAMADMFEPNKPLGEAGVDKLSGFVDEFYGRFVAKVAAGRNTRPDAVHEVAQGRVWTGAQALEVGLVDQLGSFRTALAIAKEKAEIDGEATLVLYPHQATFLEEILGQAGASSLAPLLRQLRGLQDTPLRALEGTVQQLLTRLSLFSSGQPVLLPPYQLHAE